MLRGLLGNKTTTMADRYVRHAGSAVADATEPMAAELAALIEGKLKNETNGVLTIAGPTIELGRVGKVSDKVMAAWLARFPVGRTALTRLQRLPDNSLVVAVRASCVLTREGRPSCRTLGGVVGQPVSAAKRTRRWYERRRNGASGDFGGRPGNGWHSRRRHWWSDCRCCGGGNFGGPWMATSMAIATTRGSVHSRRGYARQKARPGGQGIHGSQNGEEAPCR